MLAKSPVILMISTMCNTAVESLVAKTSVVVLTCVLISVAKNVKDIVKFQFRKVYHYVDTCKRWIVVRTQRRLSAKRHVRKHFHAIIDVKKIVANPARNSAKSW